MLRTLYRIISKTLLWLVLLCIIAVGCGALYVRFHPVNITKFTEKILPYIAPNINLAFSELWLSYDGKFTVSAENVSFEGAKTSEKSEKIGGIERLEFRLANRSLLLLSPSPKHIVVEGFYYEGTINTNKPEADQLTKTQNTQQKLEDLAKLIKRMRYLSTLELSKINVILQDTSTNTKWALQNGAGQGTYYGENGLNIKLNGQLAQNSEAFSPAEISLQTDSNTHTTNISVNLADINSGWMNPYLPNTKQDIFQGQVSLRLGSNWSPKTGWTPLLIKSELKDITLNIPEVYKEPHKFNSAAISAQYNFNNQSIKLLNFNAIAEDFNLNLSGNIKDLKGDITTKLEGNIVSEKALSLFAQLPSARMKKVLPWLQENIQGTFASDVSLTINAPLKTLFKCAPNVPCEGLTMVADIAPESSIKPLKQAPKIVAKELSKFYIRNGKIEVTIPRGTIGEQTLTNVAASLSNIQTIPTHPRILSVSGMAVGELKSALPVIKDIFKINLPYNLEGQHNSQLNFKIPFKKGAPPVAENISFTLVSKVNKAELIDGINGKNLTLNNTKLNLKDAIITANGSGNYAANPLEFTYKNTLKDKRATGRIISSANLKDLPFVPPTLIQLTGTAPLIVDYELKGKNQPLQLEIKSDLSSATAKIPKLNWQHNPGTPLQFNLQGSYIDNALNAELFTLTGSAGNTLNNARQNTEIAGSFYYAPKKKKPEFRFQASPFVLGGTNANITYTDDTLTMTGKNLDFTRALNAGANSKINWPENFKAIVSLDRVLVRNGYIQNLKINTNRPNNKWETFTLTGALPDATNFNAKFKPNDNGYQFQTRFSNLGAFLTNLGISEQMHGGQLIGQLTLDANRNGSGTFTLNNTRLVDAPVLVQILSLLSLDQLLSNTSGIEFETGLFPIKKTGKAYALKKAHLTGPSMALQFDGDILPEEKHINLDGSLVPTAGINRAINNIPVIGDLLTGSQDGLFVAEFKVKGDWSKPKTTVKPLSTVTPGIIKDFFNIFTGKSKE